MATSDEGSVTMRDLIRAGFDGMDRSMEELRQRRVEDAAQGRIQHAENQARFVRVEQTMVVQGERIAHQGGTLDRIGEELKQVRASTHELRGTIQGALLGFEPTAKKEDTLTQKTITFWAGMILGAIGITYWFLVSVLHFGPKP